MIHWFARGPTATLESSVYCFSPTDYHYNSKYWDRYIWAMRIHTDQTLIRVCTVCQSACTFWRESEIVKPYYSNFRITDPTWNGLSLHPSLKSRKNKDYSLSFHTGSKARICFPRFFPPLCHFDWTVKPVNQFPRQQKLQQQFKLSQYLRFLWNRFIP